MQLQVQSMSLSKIISNINQHILVIVRPRLYGEAVPSELFGSDSTKNTLKSSRQISLSVNLGAPRTSGFDTPTAFLSHRPPVKPATLSAIFTLSL